MRDSAGDSGEFYTPRPVVRFMVEAAAPKLGETVLDPACGTGGFLVETYLHLEKLCRTVQERRMLQERAIFGQEAKPLPYMLSQMNLLLHGLEYPQIGDGNSLAVKLTEIGDKDRVDVILTNPPFGGEEEKGILAGFPEGKQTAETALLFLQLIMRKLRRPPRPGRAAVVVPNGTLFGDGVAARIKEQLLTEFNLHTIVRLPNGVFAPYTSIPTNLLFFDRTGVTKEIWYYEHPLPEGRKQYTKTAALQFEEFAPCLAWWNKRKENERAWKVKAKDVLANSCNLDLKNPRAAQDLEHFPPEQLLKSILEKERRIIATMAEVKQLVDRGGRETEWPVVRLGDVVRHRKEFVRIDDLATYKRCRVQLHAQGIVLRDQVSGLELKTKDQQICHSGELLVAEIDAKVGGYGIVPDELDGAIVSSHYFLFEIDAKRLHGDFLKWFLMTTAFADQVKAQGSTNYAAIRPSHVLGYLMPLPPLSEQHRTIAVMEVTHKALCLHLRIGVETGALQRVILDRAFRGEL